jgi:hypothetical protein
MSSIDSPLFTATLRQTRAMSASPFSAAHRRYVKSLYKRILENERNWVVRYDLYRARACAVRAEFERNRYVSSTYNMYRLIF